MGIQKKRPSLYVSGIYECELENIKREVLFNVIVLLLYSEQHTIIQLLFVQRF